MAETLSYPLRIERHAEDGGYLAHFPDLPGCQTWGETYEAAIENAEEALTLYLETLIANGAPTPPPQSCATAARAPAHTAPRRRR